MSTRPMLVAAARALGELTEKVVFTGGATISEYVDEVVVDAVRATMDVDVVVEVATRTAYYDFMARLDDLGWSHPQLEGNHPICRRRTPHGLLVDVMPSAVDVLGFSNRWYAYGFDRSGRVDVADDVEISLFPVDVLLASKIEAFQTRGRNDWYASHDLEDILTVVEGRSTIVPDVRAAPAAVGAFVASWAQDVCGRDDGDQIVEAHIHPGLVRAGRLDVVLERLQRLSAMGR